MAIPTTPNSSPAMAAAVEEIMSAYRSLPPRPSVENVEAAMAVIDTSNYEEATRIKEVSMMRKPEDVPEEIFEILVDVRKNMAMFQGYEQRREALLVVELDNKLQVFDNLIQSVSMFLFPDSQGRKREEGTMGSVMELPRMKRSLSSGEESSKKGESNVAALKYEEPTGDNPEKLSLVQVASLIETHAKTGNQVLDLQGKLKDQIEWLPQSLGKLQGVKDLNLSENRIAALPSNIGALSFLTKLDVHSNQLVDLPDSIGDLSNLTDLDLHANKLKSLPASIGKLICLETLDISSNQLLVLPDTLGSIQSLRKLNAETNELEELPFTIGSFSLLSELRLDFNQIRGLPEAIGKLESLEVLTLHYNRIQGLPTTMSSMTKLKELDVSFNELRSIPESLCFATSLVKLDVSRNFADLRELPRSIGNLESLEELDISDNQIRFLPESFRFLSSLRVFRADETPLEQPPKEVLKLGAQGVVQYIDKLVKTKEAMPSQVSGKDIPLCSCFCSLIPMLRA